MARKKRIQPEGTFDSSRFGFTQVVKTKPGRLVFVSGQVALDRGLNLVGAGDIAAQAVQAAGATPSDVAMMRTYIADYVPEYAGALEAPFADFFGKKRPASTRVGVQALAAPGLLIEIEAIAVIDD